MTREDPTVLLRNIGLRIAELRGKRDWSREALAEKLKVSARYVGRIETGGQNLSVISASRGFKLARFGVRVVDLFAAPGIDRIRVGRPPGRS